MKVTTGAASNRTLITWPKVHTLFSILKFVKVSLGISSVPKRWRQPQIKLNISHSTYSSLVSIGSICRTTHLKEHRCIYVKGNADNKKRSQGRSVYQCSPDD